MKNNNKATRIIKTHKIKLNADAKTVFLLLCPAKEADWIEGWDKICNIIYTESGIAEEGCVFETNKQPEGKAIWICSHYNFNNTTIEYIKHVENKAIIKWKMEVKEDSQNASSILVNYNITGLTDEGNEYATNFMEVTFPIFMKSIEDGINHYIEKEKKENPTLN